MSGNKRDLYEEFEGMDAGFIQFCSLSREEFIGLINEMAEKRLEPGQNTESRIDTAKQPTQIPGD